MTNNPSDTQYPLPLPHRSFHFQPPTPLRLPSFWPASSTYTSHLCGHALCPPCPLPQVQSNCHYLLLLFWVFGIYGRERPYKLVVLVRSSFCWSGKDGETHWILASCPLVLLKKEVFVSACFIKDNRTQTGLTCFCRSLAAFSSTSFQVASLFFTKLVIMSFLIYSIERMEMVWKIKRSSEASWIGNEESWMMRGIWIEYMGKWRWVWTGKMNLQNEEDHYGGKKEREGPGCLW